MIKKCRFQLVNVDVVLAFESHIEPDMAVHTCNLSNLESVGEKISHARSLGV